jgi:hypothetical protein
VQAQKQQIHEERATLAKLQRAIGILRQQEKQRHQSHLWQDPHSSFFLQTHPSSQAQPSSYHHTTTNYQQSSQTPQITYSPPTPQTTYPPPLPSAKIPQPQQQSKVVPTHTSILTIIGGSNTEPNTKRQSRDSHREVNHVMVECPITQTKWSNIPIIFSAEDVNITSFPHTDVMVITVHIDRWNVSRILVDNGSQEEILFLVSINFKKMGYDKNQLKNR